MKQGMDINSWKNPNTHNMEENKEVKREARKLTYEELENAARQISMQMDNLVKENRQLKIAVQQLQLSNMYTELGFKFKVLENTKMFNEEFVEKCISDIEETMSPKEPSETEENVEK